MTSPSQLPYCDQGVGTLTRNDAQAFKERAAAHARSDAERAAAKTGET